MSRLMKTALIALVALVTLAPAAPMAMAQRRVVVVGGGFYGGWYAPGWYGPGWYGPRYGYYGPYGPAAGNVKIVTKAKGNSIYVDGGYAGLTGKLKQFALRPGSHEIAFRDSDGRTFYQQRVEVLMGKTIAIHPDGAAPQNQG
ncbi:MAG TPA: hypothetical protein VI455_18290 [Terriglobia bacterium]